MFGDTIEKLKCTSCNVKYIIRWNGSKPRKLSGGKSSARCPYCNNIVMIPTGGTSRFSVYPYSVYSNHLSKFFKNITPFILIALLGIATRVIPVFCDDQILEVVGDIGLELGAAAIIMLFVDKRIEYKSAKTEDKIKQMISLRIEGTSFHPTFIKTQTKESVEMYEGEEVYGFMKSHPDWLARVASLEDTYSPNKTIESKVKAWIDYVPKEIDEIAKLATPYPDILSELIKIKDQFKRFQFILWLQFNELSTTTSETNAQRVKNEIVENIKRLNEGISQYRISFKASESLY